MYIHVDFKDTEQVELFNKSVKLDNAAQKYIDMGVSDIIYDKETGNILLHVMNGKLEYLPMLGETPLLNIAAISYIDLDKNEIVK